MGEAFPPSTLRFLLTCLLIVLPAVSSAANPFGYIFTIEPNPAPPGSPITITVESTKPTCKPLPTTGKLYVEGDIAYFHIPDSDGCEGIPPATRTFVNEPLPSGNYTINFFSCGHLGDDGNEVCTTLEEIPFSVLSAPGIFRHKIPAASAAGLTMFGVIVLLIALGACWRRRG